MKLTAAAVALCALSFSAVSYTDAQAQSLQVEVDYENNTLSWQDAEGEVSYRVTGRVTYIPSNVCDLPTDLIFTEDVQVSSDLPVNTTTFVLPPATDPRADAVTFLDVTVEALDSTGEVLASGGYGIVVDVGLCPPDGLSPPAGTISLPTSGGSPGPQDSTPAAPYFALSAVALVLAISGFLALRLRA